MTKANLTTLNQDQLIQAALDASAGGDSPTAIVCLTAAVKRPDATAMAYYLLAAEYAQVQQYDTAIAGMEAALALDPALHTARLQLGLLYLGANDEARGVATLAVLERLDALQPLHHFAAGLVLLMRGEPAAALEALETGMGLNFDLPALNVDMQRIASEIVRQGMAAEPDERPEPSAMPVAEEGVQHVLLSAYTSNRLH